MLRSQDFPENPPPISPPSVKGFPPPAPLVFSLSKNIEKFESEEAESVENVEVGKVVETAKDAHATESCEESD